MSRTFTAIIHREDPWYVASCPETGTTSQGLSAEEALANLREATELFLEEFPLESLPPAAMLTTFEVALHA